MNMKKIFIIGFILLIISCLKIYSQGSNNFLNRTPDFPKITTPNAASFDKFIDNPVSLYNGSVDVSIPIYTLKDGDIELPITLRYNTSGIKVSEEASWVGLGWNLNVGGVITQNVVGDYDDMDSNYNTIISKSGIGNVSNPYYVPQFSSDWVKSFYEYTGLGNVGRSGRLNPDVFYYSYPGGGGKFIFDYRNDSIYILSRESAERIEVLIKNNTGIPNIQEFKITTASGSQHFFRYFTRLYNSGSLLTSSVSYVLYKSIYPNKQQVDYTYESKAIRKVNRSNIFQSSLSIFDGGCDLMGHPVSSTTGDASEGAEFYLGNIKTTNYQINFETSGRTDLMNGLKLNKIKISPRNNNNGAYKPKEFIFEYDYFTSDKNTIGWKLEESSTTGMVFTENQNLQRLKLLAAYEQNGTNKINKYNFTYDPTNLPAKTSYSVDYWGNYNGQSGKSYFPDLNRLLWGEIIANNQRSRMISGKYSAYVSSTNRGYDYNCCKAGTLAKITYPTGGTKEIIYEANTFIYPTELPTAKDQINTSQMSDFSLYVSDFNQTSGGQSEKFTIQHKSVGTLRIIVSRGQHTGSYADGHFWWNLKGSRVTIVNQGNGNIPINYDLTDDCHVKGNCYDNPNCDNSEPNLIIEKAITLNPGNYLINVNMTDNIPDQRSGSGPAYANVAASLVVLPDPDIIIPPTSQEVQGCGIRVAQVVNDFGDNNKTRTSFEYSGGILHDVLQYIKVHDNIYLNYSSSCEIRDSDGQIRSSFFHKKDVFEVFGNNTMSNPYASTGGVGYSYVKDQTISNNTNQGWTISEFNNTAPYTAQESVRIDNPLDGKPIKTTVYLNNNIIKKEVKYNYSYNTAHRYFGVNFRKNINDFTNIFAESGVHFNNPDLGNPLYTDRLFTVIAHKLNANDILLNNVTTIADNVSVTESYTYNTTTLQLTGKKISKSDGNNLEYKYSYPNDYNFSPYTNMVTAHVYSPMIEEKIFNNNKYIGGTLTKYKAVTQNSQTIYLPDKKYFSSLSTPLTTAPATFSSSGENTTVYPFANIKYENQTLYGKPQLITYNDSERIVYLWSYSSQYPIAEIKNATFAEAEAAAKTVFSVASADALSALSTPNEAKLKDGSLQKALPNALVTTYTYKPLVGILTATDPSGITTYYDYDSFGRLKETYIMENSVKKVVQSYDYHYQNQ